MATLTQGVPRGFPNIVLVRDSLRTLVPRIKRGMLPPPPPAPWQGHRQYDRTDPILSIQRLAKSIGQEYRLVIGTVVVSFSSSLDHAAHVEIGHSNDYFIEVNSAYKNRPGELGAILGHELAHIFLHRHGLSLQDTMPNEILTDTTAALYGFGLLMADSFQDS